MGVVAGISAAAAAASLGSTVSGAFSGGGGGGSAGGYYNGGGGPPVYIPQNQPAADAAYWGLTQPLQSYGADLINQQGPFWKGYLNNIQQIQNAYSPGIGAGVNAAQNYGLNTLAPAQQGGAAGLYGAGNQVLGTAFDPQKALYGQLQQQTVDQSNATNSMYGLGSSPYGAGVAGQNLNNFNIDWQNAQLQRQMQGIQSAGQAYSGASGLGQSAYQTLSQVPQLGYQTSLGFANDAAAAAGQQAQGYTGMAGLDQNTLNALAAYLRLGQGATGVGQAGQQAGFNQNQLLGSQLATSLTNPALTQGLSSLFASPSSFQSPADIYGGTNYSGYGASYGGGLDPTTGFGYGTGGY